MLLFISIIISLIVGYIFGIRLRATALKSVIRENKKLRKNEKYFLSKIYSLTSEYRNRINQRKKNFEDLKDIYKLRETQLLDELQLLKEKGSLPQKETLKPKADKQTQTVVKPSKPWQNRDIPLPYKLNESLLTKRENKFFCVLRPIANRHGLYIAVKPRMADFIENLGSKYSFYRISQKHVDFLLCGDDMKPIMALELDDSTHEREDRKARDELVSKIYKEVGLKLVQIYEYDDEILDLHLMLAKMNCKECGSFLVLRQNSKDKSYFAGCSGFPRCHYKGMKLSDAKRIYESVV